jgi:hypothetical protein
MLFDSALGRHQICSSLSNPHSVQFWEEGLQSDDSGIAQ